MYRRLMSSVKPCILDLNRSEYSFKLIKEGFLKGFLGGFFLKILSVLLEDLQHQQSSEVVKRFSFNSRSIYRYVNSGCTSGNDKSSRSFRQICKTLGCVLTVLSNDCCCRGKTSYLRHY